MNTDLNLICYMKFGSHLYGTDGPDSDLDYKGIYLPTKRQLLLGRFQKSMDSSTGDRKGKNTKDDVDEEIFSLHQFIKLACEGQTIAMDMLHASKNMIITSHPIWEHLQANRKKFYTKNLQAFVGYARKQAAKYGIKGSRLAAIREIKNFLFKKLKKAEFAYDSEYVKNLRLRDYWNELPTGEHIHFFAPSEKSNQRMYQVCGKKLQESSTLPYVLDILDKFYKSYGKRALMAEQNKGIDWKAVSHAMRAAYQLRELFQTGDIKFPLNQARNLYAIKQGHMDYKTEVAPRLELLMDEVESLSAKSQFPEKVDTEFWDNELIKIIETHIL